MKPIWILAALFVFLLIAAVLTRSQRARKAIAIVLFLIIAVNCTLYFEASVRIVLENANASGELSKGFVLGVRRLSGWLIWERIVTGLAACGLLVVALRKP
jgi:uncharacterized membrane protein